MYEEMCICISSSAAVSCWSRGPISVVCGPSYLTISPSWSRLRCLERLLDVSHAATLMEPGRGQSLHRTPDTTINHHMISYVVHRFQQHNWQKCQQLFYRHKIRGPKDLQLATESLRPSFSSISQPRMHQARGGPEDTKTPPTFEVWMILGQIIAI